MVIFMKDYILTAENELLRTKLENAARNAVKILEREMPRYISGALYPADYENGKYGAAENGNLRNLAWLEGFWTGQLWLAYEFTKDEKFKELAEKNVVDFEKRMVDNLHIDWHHDMGFLYSLSCVAAYRLTGSTVAKKTALQAAYSLSRRFRPRGEFIKSMSFETDAKNYKFIIDTMMNLPLLFWASEETGENLYRERAIKHAETSRKYLIRDDNSTYHHFLMDFKTAGPVRGLTWQGYSDESCWTRGQAWMIYGAALMYSYTKDNSWVDTFYKVTDYFIEHLPEDYVPLWDFAVIGTGDDDRDSSAAAIAVCGILEMAQHISFQEGKMAEYIQVACKILESLADNYAIDLNDETEGLLGSVMSAKPQGIIRNCEIFGDYFYLEALIRALMPWKKYW